MIRRPLAQTLLRSALPWWVLVWVWFWVLYYLSSNELPDLGGPPTSDKVAHFGYFGLGGGLMSLALLCGPRPLKTGTAILVVIVFSAVFGLFDEWHQLSTPGRQGGDPGDFTANLLGGTFAALVTPLLLVWVRRPSE